MDFLRYMNDKEYDEDYNNCWHFVQRVFQREKGHKLPDYPIFDTHKSFKSRLLCNVKYKEHDLRDCQEGCIVHVSALGHEHAGYAINNKQYIHKTRTGVQVADIPAKAQIYEIIN
ncbi:MAG: C40 family peptidase [Heliobacteriaceae bacterium]|jgi:cell wall-associated NlpC family hydrolase|nr:C40 family peptidase [Heliobacteriaceae bacterium]